jgi:hypothetical protein
MTMSTESERDAYNAAFYALGLRWHWDRDTYAALQAFASPCDRIRRYLETQHPHLLKAYDPEFLAHAVEARKPQMSEACSVHFDWAQARAAEVGI